MSVKTFVDRRAPGATTGSIRRLVHSRVGSGGIVLCVGKAPRFPRYNFSTGSVRMLARVNHPFTFIGVLRGPRVHTALPGVTG